MMKALVYGGPGAMEWTDVALPEMHDARDAIVRVDVVTICGTDLHILKGDVPEVVSGRILGHEAVGTVLELGDAVTGVSEGSRVLVSCISGCGRCRFCRTGAYGQCLERGGWVLGHHQPEWAGMGPIGVILIASIAALAWLLRQANTDPAPGPDQRQQ